MGKRASTWYRLHESTLGEDAYDAVSKLHFIEDPDNYHQDGLVECVIGFDNNVLVLEHEDKDRYLVFETTSLDQSGDERLREVLTLGGMSEEDIDSLFEDLGIDED